MDMESGKQQFITAIKKYQYILWVVLIGILLMLAPERSGNQQNEPQKTVAVHKDLEMELSVILSHISGVGKAEVLLTEAAGSNTIYQVDAGKNQSHSTTVIVNDENRKEQGLIKQVLPPAYRGAVIVCQGADSAHVRLAVVDAVKSATGLSSNCITVLRMK